MITSKYFGKKKLSLFGLVISRKGLDKSGKSAQARLWREDDKLLISLTDDDLLKMLELKENGELSEKVIDQRLRDFLSSIE